MSNFKWKNLLDINSKDKSYLSPLSCIVHIDVNAFFAQAEQIRCNYTIDDPIVCVQWSSIIAVSYAAKKYGITRMDTVQSALEKCDKLIPIHTAVFKKGEDVWEYHDDYRSWMNDPDKQHSLSPEYYKVSLDPYRRESRKLLKIFHQWCDLVEKASIDEVFLDFGRECFSMLMFDEEIEGFEDIRNLFIEGNYNLDGYLPPIPTKISIKFMGDVYNPKNRPLFHDWDDIIMCLNSIKASKVRKYIKTVLGYTTSCGISKTKYTSKLASNFKKPNAQTIIINKCIEDFLDNGEFEITSFWTLGGMYGQKLIQILGLPEHGTIKYIRNTWPSSSNEIQDFIDDMLKKQTFQQNILLSSIDFSRTNDISEKIYHLVRGSYQVPVIPKSMINMMMSNKNMRGNSCMNIKDCIQWLKVFSGELTNRVKELQQEYNKLFVPRTLCLGIKGADIRKHTKSIKITSTTDELNSNHLLKLGTKLIMELSEKLSKSTLNIYPLTNINMIISNFEIIEKHSSIIDKLGNQKKTQLCLNRIDNLSDEMTISSYLCQMCKLTFDNEKKFQEHKDYHYALKLSEGINGVSKESDHLSYGERKLLFGRRKSSHPLHEKNKFKKLKPNKDIITFLKKK